MNLNTKHYAGANSLSEFESEISSQQYIFYNKIFLILTFHILFLPVIYHLVIIDKWRLSLTSTCSCNTAKNVIYACTYNITISDAPIIRSAIGIGPITA